MACARSCLLLVGFFLLALVWSSVGSQKVWADWSFDADPPVTTFSISPGFQMTCSSYTAATSTTFDCYNDNGTSSNTFNTSVSCSGYQRCYKTCVPPIVTGPSCTPVPTGSTTMFCGSSRSYTVQSVDISGNLNNVGSYTINFNCAQPRQPVFTSILPYCAAPNSSGITFNWAPTNGDGYEIFALSNLRGAFASGDIFSTSWSTAASNGEIIDLWVRSFRYNGPLPRVPSPWTESGWKTAPDCSPPGRPVAATWGYCSNTQAQIYINWAIGAQTDQFFWSDPISGLRGPGNPGTYAINTPYNVSYPIGAVGRRFVTGPGGASYAFDTYANGAVYGWNVSAGWALIYQNGVPDSVPTVLSPDCSPPVVYTVTPNFVQGCLAVNQPYTLLMWTVSPQTSYYDIWGTGWAYWVYYGLNQSYNYTYIWGGNNTIHNFQVRAAKSVGGFAESNIVPFTQPDCSPPPAPVLNAPIVSTNATCALLTPPNPYANLSWSSAGARPRTYNVYRSNTSAGVFTAGSKVYPNLSITTQTDPNLQRNTTYYWGVDACWLLPGNTITACTQSNIQAGTPPPIVTPWCDTEPPKVRVSGGFAPGCYDVKKWGASQVIGMTVTDNISGAASGVVRLVKTTAPTTTINLPAHCVSGDCGVTNRATTSYWESDPIPFSAVSPGNRYDEYELWLEAMDNGGPPPNDSGYQPQLPIVALPGVTDLNAYFYTQPSCAKPYLRTGQGSVHSNEGNINVPTPPP